MPSFWRCKTILQAQRESNEMAGGNSPAIFDSIIGCIVEVVQSTHRD